MTAQPQDDQLLFGCHVGHQKGLAALGTLALLPLSGTATASPSPGLA